ncbi:hypothetical protein [uncultured Tateyamaria sp.]|uniref:hypothetical protein n=1 Tax=Tateyamaria sp. 1078 TaxID=3417464 RepID=UPI002610B2D7|nr:hypothetical protein [uncultured Tateyamaria sp.]
MCVLGACDAPVADSPEAQAPIAANTVRVDVSGFAAVEGRTVALSPARVGQDIAQALAQQLRQTADGAVIADITLDLTSVRLTSRGAAFAFGGPSRIAGILTAHDARTGAVMFGPTPVVGTSETLRLPGVIGVATSPSPTDDYRQTVLGFAVAVQRLLNARSVPAIDA